MTKLICCVVLASLFSAMIGLSFTGSVFPNRPEPRDEPSRREEADRRAVREALRASLGNSRERDLLAPGDFSEVRKRTASDLFTNDLFGWSVAVSGNTAVIGAPNDDTAPRTDQGSAYVFERNVGGVEGWTQVTKLAGSTPDGFEEFGYSVAISGSTIVVGKRYEMVAGAPRNGTAYVFERNAGGSGNWGLTKTLSANGATVFDGFGQAVSISGNIIAIGAPDERIGGVNNRGAAYFFYRNAGGTGNWGQASRIDAADGGEANRFGSAVAISGSTFVAGANRNSIGTFTFEGAAYVFERHEGGTENWGEVAKLRASDASERDYFGWSVAIDANTIVVGKYQVDSGFESNGAAYVFERNAGGTGNWGEVRKLSAADGQLNDYFGQAVSVRGDVIAVGALGDDTGIRPNHGSVYVFERNYGGAGTWGERQKIEASDPGEQDAFGNSVAIDGKVIVAGSFADDISGPVFHQNAGSAYFLVRETVSWVGNAKSVTAACTVDDGFGASVAVDGETAVVGTPQSDIGGNPNQGAAYVFKRVGQNWTLVRTLAYSGALSGTRFGQSVAISGDTVAVGAPYTTGASGAVYLFRRDSGGTDNWGEVKRVVSSDSHSNQRLGASLSLEGDRMIAGGEGATVGANILQGAAYVFERNSGGAENWGEVKKIAAPDGASFDKFGASVGVSNDRIIVGAPNHSATAPQQGAAYVFELDEGGPGNWGLKRKLIAASAQYYMQFGASVGISDVTAVVGAWSEKVGSATQRGAAHVFGRDSGGSGNWGLVRRILASDGTSYDYFGTSVAIKSDRIVVGATSAGTGLGRGKSYLFERDAGGVENWGETRIFAAVDEVDYDAFGSSVAIDADDLFVAAFRDDVGGAADLGSANAFQLNAGSWVDLGKIHPAVPQNCGLDDDYGFAVAIDGDTAVIGAPRDDVGSNADQGSAYILSRNAGGPNAWGLVRVLTASDGDAGDNFGSSVKIDGDTVAVGAYQDDVSGEQDQGSVYLFDRNRGGIGNWGEIKRVTINGGGANQRVGRSIALGAETLAIGHVGDNTNTGAVHVFERDAGGPGSWMQTRVLRPSDAQIGQQFGVSIAISGDVLAVGSNLKLVNGIQSGTVYLLGRDAGGAGVWGELLRITPADAAQLISFGAAVDVDGDRLAVGAPQALDPGNVRSGAVYLFERNAGGVDVWGQVRKLHGSDSADGDRFGGAVAIDGDSLIGGAALADVGPNADQGAAYVFRQNQGGNDNWGEVRKLFAGDGAAGDEFGISVDLSGENFLAGAYLARLFSASRNRAQAGTERNGAGYFFGEASFAPTAASVTVSGRVSDGNGVAVRSARVYLTDETGESISAITNPFGRFIFDGVESGRLYVISAESKGLSFEPQFVFIKDAVVGLEITGMTVDGRLQKDAKEWRSENDPDR